PDRIPLGGPREYFSDARDALDDADAKSFDPSKPVPLVESVSVPLSVQLLYYNGVFNKHAVPKDFPARLMDKVAEEEPLWRSVGAYSETGLAETGTGSAVSSEAKAISASETYQLSEAVKCTIRSEAFVQEAVYEGLRRYSERADVV